MKVQVDGARFANAVAALGCAPADIAWRAGVDVLWLGGTKNGLPSARRSCSSIASLPKSSPDGASRAGSSRRKCAFSRRHGSACSRTAPGCATPRMRTRWRSGSRRDLRMPGVRLLAPVEANGVFVDLPRHDRGAPRKGWRFYEFVGETGVRLMCAWDTTHGDHAASPPTSASSRVGRDRGHGGASRMTRAFASTTPRRRVRPRRRAPRLGSAPSVSQAVSRRRGLDGSLPFRRVHAGVERAAGRGTPVCRGPRRALAEARRQAESSSRPGAGASTR